MAINILQTVDIIETMENFIAQIRPPKEIRDKLDISYRIEDQSILVFTIRPIFNKPNEKKEYPFAKTTYIKTQNHWKVFWMRADLKWHSYTPTPTVETPNEFCNVIAADKHGCFVS